MSQRAGLCRQLFTSGVAMIGDRVIWDGKAEALGVEPLPVVRPHHAAPQRRRRPGQGAGKGQGAYGLACGPAGACRLVTGRESNPDAEDDPCRSRPEFFALWSVALSG